MYHIFPPQGQTQFLAAEAPENGNVARRRPRRPKDFIATLRSAVGGLDQNRGRLTPRQCRRNLIKPGNKRARAPRPPQNLQATPRQRQLHLHRQVGGRRRGGLEGPREQAFLHRFVNSGATRIDPRPAPRQFLAQVGNNATVGTQREPDESLSRQGAPRYNTPSLDIMRASVRSAIARPRGFLGRRLRFGLRLQGLPPLVPGPRRQSIPQRRARA